jgi:hypothetical protein
MNYQEAFSRLSTPFVTMITIDSVFGLQSKKQIIVIDLLRAPYNRWKQRIVDIYWTEVATLGHLWCRRTQAE